MHTLVQSPPTLYQVWYVWPIEWGGSDGTSLPRWGYKRYHASVLVVLSLGSRTLEKWSCSTVSSPVERTMWRGTEACQWGHERGWKGVLLPWLSIQMTTVPANTMTATSGETEPEPFLSFSLIPESQNLREIINVCYFKLLNLGAVCNSTR